MHTKRIDRYTYVVYMPYVFMQVVVVMPRQKYQQLPFIMAYDGSFCFII